MTTLYTLGHSLARRLVGVLPADCVRRLEDGQATEADMRAAARELRESGEAFAADFVLAATKAEQLEREAEWCAAECEAQHSASRHEDAVSDDNNVVTIKPGAEPVYGMDEARDLLGSLVLEWMLSPQADTSRLGSAMKSVLAGRPLTADAIRAVIGPLSAQQQDAEGERESARMPQPPQQSNDEAHVSEASERDHLRDVSRRFWPVPGIQGEEDGARGLPACAVCGSVATCFGLYHSDEEEDWAYACDVCCCCGHSNEDGTCKPVANLGELWRTAAVQLRVMESDLSRAQRRVQTLKSKVSFYKEKARLATVTIKPGAEPTYGAKDPSTSELLAGLVLEWTISPQAAATRLGSVIKSVLQDAGEREGSKTSHDTLTVSAHARAALTRAQERLNETEARVNAALELAQRGWAVVPVCPGDKGPLRPALCPATDPVHIRDWWRGAPDANIGIATGSLSGIWVLDIDGDAGRASLAELEVEHGTLPATLTARTPRGLHLYWRGCSVRNGVSIGAGLGVRGDGGYVVAPGSRHHSGAIYEWVEPRAGVVDAPAWLLKLAGSGRYHG